MRGGTAATLLIGCGLAACNGAAPPSQDGGPPSCSILRKAYPSGALNPADGCQLCNPGLAVDAWSSRPDLTECGAAGSDGGTFCQLGRCVNACGIGGLVILAGAPNPADACQLCDPAQALESWTETPDCDGGLPAPDGGGAGCVVGGSSIGAGELVPGQACQSCQPQVSASQGTPLDDGSPCDAGGNFCLAGTCTPGCYIGASAVAPHTFQSDRQDACCNPDLDPGAWTPGFAPLAAMAIPQASAVASAALGGGRETMVIATALGGLELVAQLPDSGFSQASIVSGASPITAVAAADVTGDGLVDLVYLDSTAPTLLAQNASHGFNPARHWPDIHDGGGLWAKSTPFGGQVLSFDPDLASGSPYLQSQVDSAGQLIDACRSPLSDCVPQALAFGSIRTPGATELVMSCRQPGGSFETLYGSYDFAVCADGGWDLGLFIADDFSTGAVPGQVVAAGDLNGDGYFEVAGASGNDLEYLPNWGPGFGYFFSGSQNVPLPGGANVLALQFAGLRGDAGGTIVALDTGNSGLEIFYPPPPYDAGVLLTASYPTVASSSAMAVGDFDGDGRPDVAVLSSSGVQVFRRQCP